MKKTVYLLFFSVFFVHSANAQFASPVPVSEIEMRDNSSQKRRALDLDRVKQEARKINSERLGPASVNNFLEIKADFEKIQVLENDLVKAYTTGKKINFEKISYFAGEINLCSTRLKENLFTPPKINPENAAEEINSRKNKENSLADLSKLIVEMDNAIGAFVGNPIFLSSKKAKLPERKKAEADISEIIRLSAAIKLAAEKERTPKN